MQIKDKLLIIMKDKNILGLDLGTNSIGWAVVNATSEEDGMKMSEILDAGSRILPMDAAMLGKFATGNTISQTAERTRYRGVRRLLERKKLRRERLHRVLKIMGFLPPHYSNALTRFGKWSDDNPMLLPWREGKDGKPEFIFRSSYEEMLALFRSAHPDLMQNGLKVPYDWTIYYLRKKALTQLISNEELAWILLHFNQKRGYRPTRSELKEEDKNDDKREEYYSLKVVSVEDSGNKKGKDTWWNVVLENGMIYPYANRECPDWVGKTKDFVVTTQLNDDGTEKLTKDGTVKRSFRAPKEDDWGLLKLKTQNDITKSELHLGSYIFRSLLQNPSQKIIGGLVRTVDRLLYDEELLAILTKQKELNPKLQDVSLYRECIEELYPQNEGYRKSIEKFDFVYLFVNDILLYHRPLKSKKSLIDDCPYESNTYKDEKGEEVRKPLKCVSRSHPLYQEFRLWQFVANLRIYKEEGCASCPEDVTALFIPDEDARVALFKFLNDVKEINQDTLFSQYFANLFPQFLPKRKKKTDPLPYRWNYVQDKIYPCNSTRGLILSQLKKKKKTDKEIDTSFLNEKSLEERLWHILYSVSNPEELKKALNTFVDKNGLDKEIVNRLSNCPSFESAYGSYSLKAVKKLLPLMRMGNLWDEQSIDATTRVRIDHIINGEVDNNVNDRVREKCMGLKDVSDFRGMPLWQACYVVYNRHSEAADLDKWSSPDDINHYLSKFKQHSMHNPVVEQVVMETLRTVRDVWRKHGHIDEIHLELGREMKNTKEKREQMSKQIRKNESTNQRIKALLVEFMNPQYCIENVIPYSPSQQERLRIFEEAVLDNEEDIDTDISEILKKFDQTDVAKRPTPTEIMRYKLWLEQRYVSPYTGQTIPLSRLFTEDYQIEHVIPQSRYFDDSLSNKVICEAEVNKRKDNSLGLEFIKKHGDSIVDLGGKRSVKIFSENEYKEHIKTIYRKNPAKARKLLMEDIPDDFIERQLNDSRYISRFIKGLLSKIVRTDDETEATSKNLIVCTGAITDRLKRDWGVNDKWNELILPRFQRMNKEQSTSQFTTLNTEGHEIPSMPLHLQRGFNKKRIDHRHHAMDAIVIACTTRQHVSLLNNEATLDKDNATRHQLSHKLRNYEVEIIDKNGKREKRSVPKGFILPWPNFPVDVINALQNIIVSFKQNLRVINKTSNYSVRYVNGKKQNVKQVLGDSWAIRKPMHKDTVFGEVNLRQEISVNLKVALTNLNRVVDKDLKKKLKELLLLQYTEKQIKAYFTEHAEEWGDVNLNKIRFYQFTKETGERYFATRKPVDATLDIEKVTDSGIRKILKAHLSNYNGDATRAFSPDGIEEMNRNIVALNGGKPHQPIYKVRWYEKSNKFAVGETGNKQSKFVEGAKGTNLFFVVNENVKADDKTGIEVRVRDFRTVPFNEAMQKMKNGEGIDNNALFILSPGDLVYVPTEDELKEGKIQRPIDTTRIYKMVSSGNNQCFFIHHHVATVIVDKVEFTSMNKMERAITGEMIKNVCVKLEVNRIGEITKIIGCPI